VLLCVGNGQIQGETILYAALDVLAKYLGSKFLDEARPEEVQSAGMLIVGRSK
jgi:hypothetical protein